MNNSAIAWLGRIRDALEVRDRGATPIRRHSEREFLGLPLIDIAVGADPAKGERHGHARGVIAIGDYATGVVAFGLHARGVIAMGLVAIGVIAIGWVAIGAVAVGGLALALVALGGAAVGVFALGGAALGVVSIGLAAAGSYAAGLVAAGEHIYTRAVQDPEVLRAIERFWGWPFGG